MDDAQTQNLGPVIQTLGMYNWMKNLCPGSTKMYLVITRHKLIGQLGSQGKKDADLRTHGQFNILAPVPPAPY